MNISAANISAANISAARTLIALFIFLFSPDQGFASEGFGDAMVDIYERLITALAFSALIKVVVLKAIAGLPLTKVIRVTALLCVVEFVAVEFSAGVVFVALFPIMRMTGLESDIALSILCEMAALIANGGLHWAVLESTLKRSESLGPRAIAIILGLAAVYPIAAPLSLQLR